MELLTDDRKYIRIIISFSVIIFFLGFKSSDIKAYTIEDVNYSFPVSLLEASYNEASVENDTLEQNESEHGKEKEYETDSLPDGKYTVTVNLWHAVSDKASMGNLALNHEALITVKKGKYIMELGTCPMTVGTITACLQTLEIKQEDMSYKTAKITARKNLGNQPSAFLFSMPHKDNFIEVKINPKVEIMGNDPLPARLKIEWDTLKQVSDTTTIEMLSKSTDTILKNKPVNLTDKETKIKIVAKENVLPDDVIFNCKKINFDNKHSSVMKRLSKEEKLRDLYEINLYSDKKERIKPNGMVDLYFPFKNQYEGKKINIYRIENGNAIKMTVIKKGAYYLFSTNQVGQFAVAEELQNELKSSNSAPVKKEAELGIDENYMNETEFDSGENIDSIVTPEVENLDETENIEEEETKKLEEKSINDAGEIERTDQLEYSNLKSGEEKEENLNVTKHILFLSIAGSLFLSGIIILLFFQFIKKGLR